ncbi:MAG: hypothetical protein H6735_10715 [Alphaproteobacteria bacterium]|nr:hypothetical protein [Alphaproteobacteria bacterium]
MGVEADPDGRYGRRTAFYDRVGRPWGDAELAFLRWEIERGVLATDGGSAWWKAVQSALEASEEGEHRWRQGQPPSGERSVDAWMAFLADPGPSTWYRAHNTTVVEAYLLYADLARQERWAEQRFLEIVLYRVLYAASLVDETTPGCLPFPRWLARRVADPRTASVDVMVHLPDFYPRHYPLKPADVRAVLHRGFGIEADLERLMDEGFVLPHAGALFAGAAEDLGIPELVTLCLGDRPRYPPRRGPRPAPAPGSS